MRGLSATRYVVAFFASLPQTGLQAEIRPLEHHGGFLNESETISDAVAQVISDRGIGSRHARGRAKKHIISGGKA